MRCEEIQLELQSYLDEKLPPAEREAIERHLSTCQACAEEAVAVKELGRRLGAGLKGWVDQGEIPPELMARIEESVRPPGARQRAWWRTWPAYTGAAAAAAVLVFLVGARLSGPAGVEQLPLVGNLAAQFFGRESAPTDDLPGQVVRTVLVNRSEERDGVTLTVRQAVTTTEATRVWYTLRGSNLNTMADLKSFQPVVTSSGGALKLERLTGGPQRGQVDLYADFAPVPAGQPLILTVKDLPMLQGGGGTWTVSFNP